VASSFLWSQSVAHRCPLMARRPRTTRRSDDRACKRNSRIYQSGRAAFLAECKARNAPCARCHGELGPIDYDAPSNTSRGAELGHRLPVSTHPWLAYSRANFQVEHCGCNRSAQAREQRQAKPKPAVAATVSGRRVRPSW
jgi:hypothetical protein